MEQVETVLAEAKAAIDAIYTAEEMAMPFADVAEGDWFEYAVHYAFTEDIMNGVSKTEFAPRQTMTRGQMLTALYRMANEPEVSGQMKFQDVSADAYYAKAVLWGTQEGIVKGTSEDLFRPNEPVTRAQAVLFLYRYAKADRVAEDHLADFTDGQDVPAYARDAMNWAVAGGILNGAKNDGEVKIPDETAGTSLSQKPECIKETKCLESAGREN